MDRRDFLKNAIGAGLLAGLSLGNYDELFAIEPAPAYDLVAVKNGEPNAMFDKGIEALGGMKKFIKKGQIVVVKPNIGWDAAPDRGANTNPQLVRRIVEHCLNAGAKEVYVFDFSCDNWQKCYKNSGIEQAVKDAKGKIIPASDKSYYQSVSPTNNSKFKEYKIHEMILKADVFINVPVLKHHSGSDMTAAMKNMMGIVWDRGYWHKNNLHQCIAQFATLRKPTLNIVDAYYVMKKNGPKGVSKEDIVTAKSLLISTDIVAVDAAAAKIFGKDPKDIEYIRLASELKVGRMDLDKLNIKRITL